MMVVSSSLSLKIENCPRRNPAVRYPPPTSSISVCFLEELQKQLLEQVELREKLEREFQNLKGKLNSAAVLFHYLGFYL